jgi:TolA-binding protein
MQAHFSPRWTAVIVVAVISPTLFAQMIPRNSPPSRPGSSTSVTDLSGGRPVYVSGKVILEGGLRATEPVEIQRVCGGMPRREGFTNSKGEFQFQLGLTVLQDASERDGNNTVLQRSRSLSQSSRYQFQGCELRAILPGFQSTSVPIRVEDDFGQVSVGTIVLSRLGNVEGATISMTSLSAPKEAREAYERARKAQAEKKWDAAEKQLNKAVEVYPQYAAAWDMLGTIHQDRPDVALREFSQSIASDPQFVNPYFGMAVIAVRQKRWTDVQQLTAQVLRLNAYAFPFAHLYNGAANFYLGRIDAAEQSVRRFQSLDSDHRWPDVSLLLADILEAKQNYDGAAQQLRDYLARFPASPRAPQITANLQRLESLKSAKQE